jgi:integrase/recombinase XerD
MAKFDVHRYKRRFELAIDGIKKSDLSKTTKRLLEEFSDYCIAEGLSLPTTVKHLFCLKNVAKWADKDLDKVEKKDMIKIVKTLEKSHYACEVKHATKVAIKKFYRCLSGGEEYPENVRWIKSSQGTKKKLPEELLTSEDIQKMINAADHIRNKALIAVLYESGCRIGELLSIRLKHIQFDDHGALITVDGKTGMRRVRLISSVAFLSNLVENHPKRDNPEAPLWLGIGTNQRKEEISYSSAGYIIRGLAKKAGIKKRVNPHLFRHSRATHLANHLTEAQMNHYFGWVQGSDMPSTYVHMSYRDVDGALLKLHGLKQNVKEEKDTISPKKCSRCEKSNPPTGKFCLRCGAPLDLETVMKTEDKRKEMDYIMSLLLREMINKPEIRNFISEKLAQIKFNTN